MTGGSGGRRAGKALLLARQPVVTQYLAILSARQTGDNPAWA